jgi:hypothetical protein
MPKRIGMPQRLSVQPARLVRAERHKREHHGRPTPEVQSWSRVREEQEEESES